MHLKRPPVAISMGLLITAVIGSSAGCGGQQDSTATTARPTTVDSEPASNTASTGTKQVQSDINARITSGTLTKDYPAVGYLSAKQNKDGYCSATLIGPRTVLTAAHCVHGEKSGWFANDLIGVTWSEARTHFRFKNNSNYDIAVVILDEPVKDITPARIAKDPVSKGDPLTLIGYGYTSNNTSSWRPNEKYVGFNTVSSVDALWFAYLGDSYNCSGDSGGPAFVGDALVGIHAWGDGNKACSATIGWDVRVDIYIDWLEENSADALSYADGSQGGAPSRPDDSNQPGDDDTVSSEQLGTPVIRTEKPDYRLGEPIRITLENLPNNPFDWVGIYSQGADDFDHIDWQYTAGAQGGNLTFTTPLDVGNYEARLFFNDNYTRITSIAFSIKTNADPDTGTDGGENPPSTNPADPQTPDGPDELTIKKAEYKAKKSELKIEITSLEASDAVLEVVGYGPMAYKQKNGSATYKFKRKGVSDPGNTVVVRTASGQELTVNIQIK